MLIICTHADTSLRVAEVLRLIGYLKHLLVVEMDCFLSLGGCLLSLGGPVSGTRA